MAPVTTSGILIIRPIASSMMLPFAAAATAIILSKLMTMSAITTIRLAANRLPAGSRSAPSSSSCARSLIATNISSKPPMSLRYGIAISSAITPVKTIRMATAAPAPRMMPATRWRFGSARHAIAITRALSPDKSISIQIILPSDSQKNGTLSSVKS